MSVTTRTGDDGTTGLLGSQRVSKASKRIHSYGDVDELNAVVGLVLCEKLPDMIQKQLSDLQRLLFTLGSDLAALESSAVRIALDDVHVVEEWIRQLESQLPPLRHFILPRGSRSSCLLHQSRTICRRAERWAVGLSERETVNPHALIFLNRVSDYLFLAARTVNHEAGEGEVTWQHGK